MVSRRERPTGPPRCQDCPYLKGRTCGSSGPADSPLAIIGEGPGREELLAGKPFIGKSGKLLDLVLKRAGIKREEAFVTNALLCQPTDSPPSKDALNACRSRLAEEVLDYPRRVILGMGNSAVRSLLGDHSFKVTARRGHPIVLDSEGLYEGVEGPLAPTVIVPTYHPAAILRNQGEYPRWLEDIKYAGRLLADGVNALKRPAKPHALILIADPNDEPENGGKDADGTQLADWPTFDYVAGIPAAINAVNYLLEKPKLAADIETGFSYSQRLGEVICLAVAWSPTDAVVFSEELMKSRGFRPHLRRLLTTDGPQWVGHNWNAYDSAYLINKILDHTEPPEGVGAINGAHDTLLEHYVLDESKGTHSLEQLARDFLGAEDYKYVVRRHTEKGDQGYENVPREVLYPYAALDTTHTFSLHEDHLCAKIHASPSLTRLYENLLLPASRFLRRVQDYGLWVDQPFIGKLDRQLSAELERAHANLAREVAPLWDTDEYMASQWATKKRPDGYNAGNYRHTSFVLQKLIGWVPMNTNERTLRDLDQTGKDQSATFGYKAKNYARGHPNRKVKLNYPYIQALIDVRLGLTAYRKLVKGTRKYLEPDGRLHTTFKMVNTETGRLSSTDPNLQNLPVPEKDDPMPARDIVGAPPGRVIIEADYSQVELRLLAHFSDDENLLNVYRTDRDLHTELSIAIWGERKFDATGRQISGYTNYQRVRAKAVNFGIAYGRGAGSIAAEHDIPEAEAEEMRQTWFNTFPSAAAWLRQLHEQVLTGRTVITPFGRRRRFGVVSRDNYVGLQNESANFPMQSTASDLTLYSAMRAQERWDRAGVDAHVVCLVHDAVVVECPESISEEVAATLRAVMEDTPRRILQPKIDFPVDVHTGYRWGTLKLEELSATKAKTSSAAMFGTKGKASGRL